MRVSSLFPSRFLKARDLDGDTIVTITALTMETFDGEDRPLLSFEEIDKILSLNRTNTKTIGELHGRETDDWSGHRIILYPTEVEFKGERMQGIRGEEASAGHPRGACW